MSQPIAIEIRYHIHMCGKILFSFKRNIASVSKDFRIFILSLKDFLSNGCDLLVQLLTDFKCDVKVCLVLEWQLHVLTNERI